MLRHRRAPAGREGYEDDPGPARRLGQRRAGAALCPAGGDDHGARINLLHIVTEIDAPSPLAYDISSLYSMSDVVAAWQERNHQSWQRVREHAEGYLESQAMRLKDEGFDVAMTCVSARRPTSSSMWRSSARRR